MTARLEWVLVNPQGINLLFDSRADADAFLASPFGRFWVGVVPVQRAVTA